MIIDFSQGIISYPSSNQIQQFLVSDAGYVNLSPLRGQIDIAFAHGNNNYLVTESVPVNRAWGPIPATVDAWMYWDIDLTTAVRSFGVTYFAPIVAAATPATAAIDQHLFNTTTKKMMVYQGSKWLEKIRVFAGKINNGVITPLGTSPTHPYAGSQVGIHAADIAVGRIITDSNGVPVRHQDGHFFTSEDEFFITGSPINAIKLESNLISAIAGETVARHQVVKYVAFDHVVLAKYDDVQTTTIAITLESIFPGQVGSLALQGVITDPAWDWHNVGAPLWAHESIPGLLVEYDPHVEFAATHIIGKPPIARVLSKTSIYFDQGLGGKGDKGEDADAVIPLATETIFGAAKLSVTAVAPNNPIVVGTNDPRNFNDRYPLPHNQSASTITTTPVGVITGLDMQTNLQVINDSFVKKSGDTMTGLLTLSGDPVTNLNAATKNYVDTRVLDNLSDVVISNPIDGQSLVFNGTDWRNGNLASRLADLSDVTLTDPMAGDALVYNGTEWVNGAPAQLWKVADRTSFTGHPLKHNVLQPTPQTPANTELYVPLHTVINSDAYDNSVPFWTVTETMIATNSNALLSVGIASTTADSLVHNAGQFIYGPSGYRYAGVYVDERYASGTAGGYQSTANGRRGRTELSYTDNNLMMSGMGQSDTKLWITGTSGDRSFSNPPYNGSNPSYFIIPLQILNQSPSPTGGSILSHHRSEGIQEYNTGPIVLTVDKSANRPITANLQVVYYKTYINVHIWNNDCNGTVARVSLPVLNPSAAMVTPISMDVDETLHVVYLSCGLTVYALNRDTLQVLWARDIPSPTPTIPYSVTKYVISTILVNQATSQIFVTLVDNEGTSNQVLYALSSTGTALWSKAIGQTLRLSTGNSTGVALLACDDDTVYVMSQYKIDRAQYHWLHGTIQIAAINTTTGVTRWEREIDSTKVSNRQFDGPPAFPVPYSSLVGANNAAIRVTDQAVVATYQQAVLTDHYMLDTYISSTISIDKTGPIDCTNGDQYKISTITNAGAPNYSPAPTVANAAVSVPNPNVIITPFTPTVQQIQIFNTDIVTPLASNIQAATVSLDVVNAAKVGQLIIDGAAPLTLKGTASDMVGMIRVDTNYLYYCAGTYDGSSDIWKRIPFTSASDGAAGRVVAGPITNYPYGKVGDRKGDIVMLSTPCASGHGYRSTTEKAYNGTTFTPNLLTVLYCTKDYVAGDSSAIWQYISEPFLAGGLQSDVALDIGSSNSLVGARRTIKVSQAVIDVTANTTATPSWRGSIIRTSSASPMTVTLPAINTTDGLDTIYSGWYTTIVNRGTATVNVAVTSSPINGTGTALVLGPGNEIEIVVDGTGYFTRRNKPYSPWRALAATGTLSPDCMYGTKFKTTLTGNATVANPSNIADGDVMYIKIKQGGAGTYTATFGTKYKWGAAGVPVISTGVGQMSLITATYNADDDMLYCTCTKGYI